MKKIIIGLIAIIILGGGYYYLGYTNMPPNNNSALSATSTDMATGTPAAMGDQNPGTTQNSIAAKPTTTGNTNLKGCEYFTLAIAQANLSQPVKLDADALKYVDPKDNCSYIPVGKSDHPAASIHITARDLTQDVVAAMYSAAGKKGGQKIDNVGDLSWFFPMNDTNATARVFIQKQGLSIGLLVHDTQNYQTNLSEAKQIAKAIADKI
jgi:hypothetical protein